MDKTTSQPAMRQADAALELRRADAPTLLTADAVALRLCVPKSTVYEASRQNRIGGVVRLGRLLRFDPIRFEKWLEDGGEALPGGWRQEVA